jgi:hypothetical protein
MKELFWSIIGSAFIGGIIVVEADMHFDKHWNYWLVSAIVFFVYWILRLGFGDDIDLGDLNLLD